MSNVVVLKLYDEIAFHDRWASSINIESLQIKEPFEAVTAVENQYILKEFGELKNKKLLDLGCGAGESSIYFAQKGAEVTAVDVSPGMIEVVNTLAQKHNVQVKTKWSCAESLPFEDDSFDLVYGNGVLHHTDYPLALKEVHRVLKKNGKAAFIEPLAHNPVINVYRKLAEGVRTKDEKPFRMKQLKDMSQIPASIKHHEFWLSSLWVFVGFYLSGVDPEKERYWKKIIYDADKIKKQFTILNKLDQKLLKLPFLRRYCWNTVLVMDK